MRSWILGLAVLAGCNNGKSGDTGTAPPPTLTEVQDQVFTPSCAFATCHQAPGAHGLVLDAGVAHDALVGVSSADAPGETLVIAGDSANSYLVKKLNGDPAIVGDQMPNTGVPLDPQLIQLVSDWIDDGAQDN